MTTQQNSLACACGVKHIRTSSVVSLFVVQCLTQLIWLMDRIYRITILVYSFQLYCTFCVSCVNNITKLHSLIKCLIHPKMQCNLLTLRSSGTDFFFFLRAFFCLLKPWLFITCKSMVISTSKKKFHTSRTKVIDLSRVFTVPNL